MLPYLSKIGVEPVPCCLILGPESTLFAFFDGHLFSRVETIQYAEKPSPQPLRIFSGQDAEG